MEAVDYCQKQIPPNSDAVWRNLLLEAQKNEVHALSIKEKHYLCRQMNRLILGNIQDLLAQTLPENAKAMLYGSQARGDADIDSDWDILIVVDKDRLLPSDYDSVTYPLTKLGWELGAEINPIMYTKKEWEASKITPFYHNVLRDAITL